MILGEFLDLLNLTKAQALYIYTLTKVIIVCKDKNFEFINF